MKCPRCGESNEVSFAFCRGCGQPLPTPESAAVTTPLPLTPKAVAPTPTPPDEPVPVYKLVSSAGLLSGRTFTIDPKGLLIGRDPASCQVVIADDEVSRIHAWVGFNEQGDLVLRDKHSANGTYVNQVRIQERVLRLTDEVSVGSGRKHLFRVERVDSPPPPGGPGEGGGEGGGGGGQKLGEISGGTSILSAAELAAVKAEEEKASDVTVKIKLTDLMASPHLELIVDKYAVRKLDIPDGGLLVGRDTSRCTLVMDHPSISGVHAELRPKDRKVVLTDRSANGTFVNGRRVSPTADLRDGDYITFGRYSGKSLIFRTGLEPELKIEKVDLTKDRITIGRDAANDVVIRHPVVSKQHAEIVKQNGKVFVIDLGSTNGTFVNGIKVKRHQLQELDRIVIGSSELRFTGASLSCAPDTSAVRLDVQNVNFQVPDRVTGKPKLLLDDLALVVKPRELIGLLGPSGAGKTTLMNVLNGFAKPSGGRVLYNGVDLYQNLSSLKPTIGFVPQEDIMHEQLSVRRCLYYAAKLRLPEDLSMEEIDRRVDEMLETLKIDPQRWDNPVSTLSRGQRKRVSIGIELLPKPGVLFLDEPTAGLDPRAETLMMMLFRQLANQGSTIIITTHLLASFGVLDNVVVLVQGRLAFYGPATKFLDYFKAEAPPDVYDDLTDNNTVPYAQELKKRFSESPLYEDLITEPLKSGPAGKTTAAVAPSVSPESTDFSLHQFKVLVARNWDLKFCDRAQTFLLFLQAPLVATLVALMASEPNQIQTIFMAMFAALWFGCSNAAREIVDEQTVFRRERQTGLKIPTYVFSKLCILSFAALMQCVSVVVILVLVKHALVLAPEEILGALAIMFLVAVNGTLIGLVISALVSAPEKALTLFPLVLIPELLLSGLFLPVNRIQTLIPLNVGQSLEGKMFAQAETKTRVEQMTKPPAPSVPRLSSSAEEAARTGDAAHEVALAVAPSPSVQKAFQKYTPAPVEGMPTFIRWLSTFAVSRWGMEALSDLCIHGQHSTQDYAYKIINTVYISFHAEDVVKLEQGLESPTATFPLASNFWKDKGPYFGVLGAYVLVMTWVVLMLMKRKDVV